MNIRFAIIDDLDSIVSIYNQAVRAGNATAHLVDINIDDKISWFQMHSLNDYPLYIVKDGNETIGWGSLSPYRPGRQALRYTAEISYYLHYEHTGKGVGQLLLDFMINDCNRLGIKNIFAIVLEINTISIKLLEKSGFVKWGYLPRVAELKTITCGQFIYGKNL